MKSWTRWFMGEWVFILGTSLLIANPAHALSPGGSGGAHSPGESLLTATAAPNDDFTNRIVLQGTNITITGDTTDATMQPLEPDSYWSDVRTCSVWYSWTAPSDGLAYCKVTANWDAQVQAFQGDTLDALTAVTTTQTGMIPVKQGDVLAIQVFSPYWESGGAFGLFSLQLSFKEQITSLNDQFANALELTQPDYSFDGNIFGATLEAGEVTAYPSTTGTLWWTFTPPSDGVLSISFPSLDFTPAVGLFEGTSPSDLTAVTPVDGGWMYGVKAGHNYKLQLGANAPVYGDFTIATRFDTLDNDLFAGRIHLEGTNVTFRANNSLCTNEPGEILTASSNAGRTLWYSWAAPVTGRVTIDLASVNVIPVVGIFTGSTLEKLTFVAAGRRGLQFMCRQGTVYQIQADGADNTHGNFTVNINAVAFTTPQNDNFENATVMVGTQPSGYAAIEYATAQPHEPEHLNGSPFKSVWWKWQAPVNGRTGISLQGSIAPDIMLAVYTGSSLESLTLVGKGNNWTFTATGGTTYYIATAVAPDVTGDVCLLVDNGNLYPASITVAGNLLKEPSFEGTALAPKYWVTYDPCGGVVGGMGGADGTTWLTFNSPATLYQDFNTTAGSTLKVKFALATGAGARARVRAKLNDDILGIAECPGDGTFWHWGEFTGVVTTNRTRLTLEMIEGVVSLDAFSVVALNARPVILTQPQSTSTFEGGSASLWLGVDGTPPLAFQWYFNGDPLPGQTSQTLSLNNVTSSQAGTYYVVVTNAFGSVRSASASLAVEVPNKSEIVMQPAGDTVAVGGYYAFSVAAAGTPPLLYQWYFNNAPITDATNRQLVLAPVELTNAGSYTVKVSNSGGSTLSLPASLVVLNQATGGGAVLFGNKIQDGAVYRLALVYDVDGATALAGSGYVAQLYAGPTLDALRAVGEPRPFSTGFDAGLFSPSTVVLPTVAPLADCFAQVRAWESSKGASYEEARALGAKFGKSAIFHQVAGGSVDLPVPLWEFQSFSLQAGLPRFTVGTLRVVEVQPDGTIQWELTGEPDSRYLIEKSDSSFNWHPLLILTNTVGTVTFSDSGAAGNSEFYRARILD